MVLLIDNHDSFTYNLYQLVAHFEPDVQVRMNDEISVSEAIAMDPSRLIISPGPRTPQQAGISMDLIKHFAGKIPILGVCLGHQCIGEVFGSKIQPARRLIFGKTTPMTCENAGLYDGLRSVFDVARYHSLVIDEAPADFRVTGRDEQGDIMSMEHLEWPIYGVQYHPESFLMRSSGYDIIKNFLNIQDHD